MYINHVMLFGNLTRDPELRSLPNGTAVASFSLATNETFKKADGTRAESATFHNVSVFGSQADLVSKYLKKGSSALVEGRLQTRSWEKDGETRYRTEVVAQRVQFGPRSGKAKEADSEDAPDEAEVITQPLAYPIMDINPSDIPFS